MAAGIIAFIFKNWTKLLPYGIIIILLGVIGWNKLTIKDLDKELQLKKTEIEKLERSVTTLNQSIDKQNALIKENQVSQDKLAKAKDEDIKLIKSLENKVVEISKLNSELQDKARITRNELKKSLTEKSELLNDLNILNKKFKSNEEKIDYLTNVIVDYENSLNSMKINNDKYLK